MKVSPGLYPKVRSPRGAYSTLSSFVVSVCRDGCLLADSFFCFNVENVKEKFAFSFECRIQFEYLRAESVIFNEDREKDLKRNQDVSGHFQRALIPCRKCLWDAVSPSECYYFEQ